MIARGICRRLDTNDAEIFHAFRLVAFGAEPRAFRFAPEDEADTPRSDVAARLQRDNVFGAFAEPDGARLIGMGGLACHTGAKTRHKALLYGMYVDVDHRGTGVADDIMAQLIETAKTRVEIVNLTVVSSNSRALRFYERWGFRSYGVERSAVKVGEGDYLDETLMALDFR
jgi:GNAT superfamily N-acetyltransferase